MYSRLTISLEDNLLNLVEVIGEPDTVISSAVRQYVVDLCMQRLESAQAKLAAYQVKYGQEYTQFHRRVTTDQGFLERLNREQPLWELDAMEWAARDEETALWRNRLTQALRTLSPQPMPA
jgi:uncharacterized protein YijF (DUF1287 family)